MTALGPVTILPNSGTAEPSVHLGYRGVEDMVPDDLIASLEGLYWFGMDFPSPLPSTRTNPDGSIGDHSWNGRHLLNMGAQRTAKSFISGQTSYYLSTLTGDDLAALSDDGSFCAVVIAKIIDPHSHLVGCWNSDAYDGWGLGYDLGTNNRYQVRTSYANGAYTDMNTPVRPVEVGYTGVVYEYLSVSYDVPNLTAKLHRRRAGDTMDVRTAAIPAAPGGLSRIAFGRTPTAANYLDPAEIVGGSFFSKCPTDEEHDALYAQLQTFLAEYDVAI